MKQTALLAASLALLAGTAAAQSFDTDSYNAAPVNRVSVYVGNLTSATTVRRVGFSPYQNLFVSCVGSAASTSQTVLFYTREGQELSRQSINCTTTPQVLVSATAGNTGASLVAVSPTAGLTAANSVTNTVILTPAIER